MPRLPDDLRTVYETAWDESGEICSDDDDESEEEYSDEDKGDEGDEGDERDEGDADTRDGNGSPTPDLTLFTSPTSFVLPTMAQTSASDITPIGGSSATQMTAATNGLPLPAG